MSNDEKPLIWIGGSRKDLAAMPKAVQREFGYVIKGSRLELNSQASVPLPTKASRTGLPLLEA